jgi:hypothetical protein
MNQKLSLNINRSSDKENDEDNWNEIDISRLTESMNIPTLNTYHRLPAFHCKRVAHLNIHSMCRDHKVTQIKDTMRRYDIAVCILTQTWHPKTMTDDDEFLYLQTTIPIKDQKKS